MKIQGQLRQSRVTAFSLIELIIVIAIIGVLAGLLFPIIGRINETKQLKLARAELNVVQSAIDEYKTKLGYYPPDNTNNVVTNQLYFELMGTTNNAAGGTPPTKWGTMDGSAVIDNIAAGNVSTFFFSSGMANTSTRMHSDDTGTAASTFLLGLKPAQVGAVDPVNYPLVKILVCSIPWPADIKPFPIQSNPILNPWRYNASHPTNNVGTYDLWVDLVIRGKTNRISNWSQDPIKL
jgi:prepilin-type N-terminal cleavage/methylation domain-containing protein